MQTRQIRMTPGGLAVSAPDLISRAQLPSWVRPLRDMPARYSVFHGTVVPGRITEYTFIVDRDGRVRFEAETRHAPHVCPRTDPSPVLHTPPAVLIAAGVEAMRRSKA